MLTGLLLTDTSRLASTLGTTQMQVAEVITSYISSCAAYITWQLVDTSDDVYYDIDKNDWRSYYSVINDYYIGLGLSGTHYCPLFILGGDDVIPMPRIPNPLTYPGREELCSDMAYCFELSTTARLRLNDFVSMLPRFAVGRLPLTAEWEPEDLSAYLSDCVGFAAKGIPVRGTAMTTTQSWLRASAEMMRDIPCASLSEDFVPLNNRMIVSPDLDTAYEEMYNGYVHELKKIDCLVCNLHGDSGRDIPFYIGEDNSHAQYTIATQPQMMNEAAPYIFNTVACFGARYIDYYLDESMLLSAMVYGTMLFCGSCDIAIGGEDREGYSELLMKLYNIYLHQGLPAGLALLKAKQDYYRTCHEFEDDERAMFTILEFNLYGCPILSMQPKMANDYKPTLLGYSINKTHNDTHLQYRPKNIEVIEGGGAHKADDIHSYVHSLVDSNLSIIRKKVETEVYQRLGIGKDNLQQVMRVSQDNREIGYQFFYEWTPQQSLRNFRMYYIVDTDCEGVIKKIIHSK